jgi:DNA-binding transcriptional LysR family regulator
MISYSICENVEGSMEWDDLRTFLAISRHGNLSAAARALGVTQTTMGRRLEALHRRAGARLLQKTPTGFVMTPAGERILAHVEHMESDVLAVERLVTGQDVRLEGTVRVTTVETFGARLIVPTLPELHRQYPGIVVELDTDTRALSLSRREADIAVRLAKFEQHDVIVKKIGAMSFAMYAATSYLAERGAPSVAAGSPGHATITLQEDLLTLPEAQWLSDLTEKADVALRSNSRDAHLLAALAGLGLACLPRYLADDIEGLERVRVPVPAPVREIWLGVHRDTRHTPRIRVALNHLTEAVKQAACRLHPTD